MVKRLFKHQMNCVIFLGLRICMQCLTGIRLIAHWRLLCIRSPLCIGLTRGPCSSSVVLFWCEGSDLVWWWCLCCGHDKHVKDFISFDKWSNLGYCIIYPILHVNQGVEGNLIWLNYQFCQFCLICVFNWANFSMYNSY